MMPNEIMPTIIISVSREKYSHVNGSIWKHKVKSIFNRVRSRDINNNKVLFEALKS